MNRKVRCWELLKCNKTGCPAFGSHSPTCWLMSGTHCNGTVQAEFLEKIDMCLGCEVLKANMDADAIPETLRLVDLQLNQFKNTIVDRDLAIKATKEALESGLEEVFEGLREISSGNPEVKIPEGSEIELLSQLKCMVNRTAENLAEIVDLSHEFAIGLAEHFDVLHRASKGDLAARIRGTSQVDLLASLKNVTNQMIEGVSKEIDERQRAEKDLRESRDSMARLVTELKKMAQDLKQKNATIDKKQKELAKAYAALQTTQSQIIQQEKMASVGQLAAGVAHEINNPTGFVSSNLKSLSGYEDDLTKLITEYRKLGAELSDGLSREALPVAAITEQMKRINGVEQEVEIDFVLKDISDLIHESMEGMDRIKKIVLNLKDFAHPGEDQMKPSDINRGLEATLSIVWNEIKYKATVKKDYGELPELVCYPQQLNQVFMNLLVNAAQAIKQKGEIGISTRAFNDYVEIRICDTGEGIPEKNLAKIFDPFFTTKPVGQGTGLGLNVAFNIIKKHNGTISVESGVGKGTTFTIRLPATPSEETHHEETGLGADHHGDGVRKDGTVTEQEKSAP
jgi:signal transduction histidine kinase